MDTVVTFLVQGARARTAAAQSATPAAPPRTPPTAQSPHGQQRPGGGRPGHARGASLTPDLLILNPPSRLALTPIQALTMRRGRL